MIHFYRHNARGEITCVGSATHRAFAPSIKQGESEVEIPADLAEAMQGPERHEYRHDGKLTCKGQAVVFTKPAVKESIEERLVKLEARR